MNFFVLIYQQELGIGAHHNNVAVGVLRDVDSILQNFIKFGKEPVAILDKKKKLVQILSKLRK